MKPVAKKGVEEVLLDIRDQNAMELVFDEECMSIWELLRRRARPSTLPAIAGATHLSQETVRVYLEKLIARGLVARLRASARRPASTFRVTCRRVGIGIRWNDPDDRRRWDLLSPRIEESSRRLKRNHAPTERASDDAIARVTYILPVRVTPSEMVELRQRLDELTAYLRILQDKHTGGDGRDDFLCNYRFELQLQPLATPVLPQPFVVVRMIDRDAPRGDSRLDPLSPLSPRERQVALSIVRGRSRGETAAELGLRPGTVATLAKRVYRKLGVAGRVELTRCIAGASGGLVAVA
jgi:DNA-binding CsgD family transcriptional regulator/DNA-binding Lrp family transcriptional regulator